MLLELFRLLEIKIVRYGWILNKILKFCWLITGIKKKKDVWKKKNISWITLVLESEQLGKCNCRVLRWGDCGKGRLGKGTESLALDLLNLRCLLDCQVISNKHSKVWSTSKNSQIQMIFKDMRPQWNHSGNEYKREDMETTFKITVGE